LGARGDRRRSTAGIVLGPSVLGLFPATSPPDLHARGPDDALGHRPDRTAPVRLQDRLGFEGRLLHKRGAAAAAVSVTSVVLSFALGAGLALLVYSGTRKFRTTWLKHRLRLFLGAAMAVTAFPCGFPAS